MTATTEAEIAHGGPHTLAKCPQKCEECRAGRAAYMREYRARIRAGEDTRRPAPVSHRLDVRTILTARARALELVAAGQSGIAREARVRLAEVRSLLANLEGAPTR